MSLNLSNIKLPIDKQFYLLKHFTEIDQEYEATLIEHGYLASEINNQINSTGSKFNKHFALNPNQLWTKIKELYLSAKTTHSKTNERQHIQIQFSKDATKINVGTDNLIPYSRLNNKEKELAFKRRRDSYELWHLKSDGLPTNIINIILSNNEPPEIVTLFPGAFAPPLPKKETQNNMEFEACKSFWDKHVLLVNK